MGFHEIRDAAGNVVGHSIVCSRGGRSSGGTCVGCKRFAGALFLCDFPVLRDGRETTCDRRICASCKTRIGPDRDLCPQHKALWDFELGVPLVGPQAAAPLKPFVEPAPGPEESPASQLLLDAPGPLDRVAPSGGDSGQHGEKAEANRTGGGFAEPVHVEADAFRPVSDDDLELPPGLREPTLAEKAAYVKAQPQTREHGCHWPGCTRRVPPAMWGCRAHWFRLPKPLRNRIWAAYVPGQEISMTPSAAYLEAAAAVETWIRENA